MEANVHVAGTVHVILVRHEMSLHALDVNCAPVVVPAIRDGDRPTLPTRVIECGQMGFVKSIHKNGVPIGKCS